MSTQTATAPPVGSSAWLASTVEPGQNFGRFNLPMNTRELVWQLSNGTPCEVPRFWLNAAMQAIEQCFGNADIKVEADRKIAQLTPNRADLNDYGRRVLANETSAGTAGLRHEKSMNQEPNPEAAETAQTTSVPAVDLPQLVRHLPAVGDYVLATKYGDGDPQDHWCVGFYAGLTNPEKYDPPRYDVVDGEGKNFRGNGFRRIKKITPERGAWMLKHAKDIELSGRSVWHFARCSMNPLPNTPTLRPSPSAAQPNDK